jgi:hypothetical protein
MGRVLRLMKSGIDTLLASHSVLDPHNLDGLGLVQRRPAPVVLTKIE